MHTFENNIIQYTTTSVVQWSDYLYSWQSMTSDVEGDINSKQCHNQTLQF